MPTTETPETAGRVTRSLRKRLTSIDSDVSSRPGTPTKNNLTIISETVTPSKRTRRASLSTPINTPSKSNTPARRLTRRRSTNIQEEEPTIQTISKEPLIDVVKEEPIPIESPKDTNRRVTRSTSKSPQEEKLTKKNIKKEPRKSIPVEDPEIINLDDSNDESLPLKTSPIFNKKKTRISIMKEKHIDEIVLEQANNADKTSPSNKMKKILTTQKLTSEKSPVTTPKISQKQENGTSGVISTNATKSASKVKMSLEKTEVQESTPTKTRKSSEKTIISEKIRSQESTPTKTDSVRKNKDPTAKSPSKAKNLEKAMSEKMRSQESTPTKTGSVRKNKDLATKSPSGVKSLEKTIISEKMKSQEGTPTKTGSGRKKNKELASKSPSEKINSQEGTPTKSSIGGTNKDLLEKSTSQDLDKSVNKKDVDTKKKTQQTPKSVEQSSNKLDSPKNDSNPSAKRRMSSLSLTNNSPKVTNNLEKQMESTSSVKEKSSPQKKNRPEKLKNVDFNETLEENTVKNVYPKTPGLTKSKSYILDSSKDVDLEDSFKSSDKQAQREDEKKSDEENEVISTKTPYKLKLKAVESSTPILNVSSKQQSTTSEIQGLKEDLSIKENKKTDDGDVSFPKSWSHSVSGTAGDSAKIDLIAPENSNQKETVVNQSKKGTSVKGRKNKTIKSDSEDSDESDEGDLLEEFNDDYDEEELEEEERNAEKTTFLDDEAMEVAEGEESMDSEEREYIEQHEIPVYGESIGSKDSEDISEDDEEPDEEDAAFIVSDTEETEDEVDLLVKGKQYKRIIRTQDSSDEEKKHEIAENADFCLLVDSSAEEDQEESEVKSSKKTIKEKQIPNKDLNVKKETLNISKNESDSSDEDLTLSELKSRSRSKKSLDKVPKTAKKSLTKNEHETSSLVTEDSSNKKLEKSVKQSTSEKEQNAEKNLESDLSTMKSRKHSDNSKLEMSDDDEDQNVQGDNNSLQAKEPEINLSTKSPLKSRKSLNKSKLAVSDNDEAQEVPSSNDNLEDQDPKTILSTISPLKSRKSLNKSKLAVSDIEEAQESLSDNDNLKVQPKMILSTMSPLKSRKSLNKSKLAVSDTDDAQEVQDGNDNPEGQHPKTDLTTNSPLKSRKSLNKSKLAVSDNDEEQEVQASYDNIEGQHPKTNVPTKSPLKSRKSLNKRNFLDNETLQGEDENNLSAKSQKKSKKSLDKSKLAMSEDEDDGEPEVEFDTEKGRDRKTSLTAKSFVNSTLPISEHNDEEEVEVEIDNDSLKEQDLNISVSAKSPMKSRKSLNNSKLLMSQYGEEEQLQSDDDILQRQDLSTSKPVEKSRKSLNKNKLLMSEIDEEQELQGDKDNLNLTAKSLEKSRKSLNRSKLAMSKGDEVPEIQSDSDHLSIKSKKSLNKSELGATENEEIQEASDSYNKKEPATMKSLNKSETMVLEEDDKPKEPKTITKSPKKSRKSLNNLESHIPQNDEYKNTNIHSKDEQKTKSPSKSIDETTLQSKCLGAETSEDDGQRNIPKPLRKSLNKSLSTVNKKKSSTIDQIADEEISKKDTSRKSLNESRHNKRESLVRTSTEESHINEENELEPEETLSANERSTENEIEKTLDTSKKLEKSLNRSKLTVEKQQQRKSISDSSDENGDKISSAEITDNEAETTSSGSEEPQFSDTETIEKESTRQEFLEEYEVSHSKPNLNSSLQRKSGNDSKLDETFQMDPKNTLSSSLHDSLHRSIFRKSLNASNLKRDIIEGDENEDTSSDSNDSSPEEDINVNKKLVSERGLSVSLSSIQIRKKIKNENAVHNSFTIGVSVRKNSPEEESSSVSTDSDHGNVQEKLPENENNFSENDASHPSEKEKNVSSDEEDLEKVKETQRIIPNKSRKSLPHSITTDEPRTDTKQQKKIKRTSLYMQNQVASNSFVEKISEEKNKIKRKKLDNSISGVIQPSTEEQSNQATEQKIEKSDTKSDNKDKHVKHILDRCDLIIEAANQAKREAKITAKNSKVKKPKWMDKNEKVQNLEEEPKIPLVSKKEIKRKEKIKKDLAKALKHSTALLNKIVEPTKKIQQKLPEEAEVNSTKRLDDNFLESLVQPAHAKKKKTKEIDTTPPSDKENPGKRSNKTKNIFTQIKDVKRENSPIIETLETACGTVTVEPATPKKLRYQHGFRESPKTPIGFKIQDLAPSNKNTRDNKIKKSARRLITASGAFVEEDLSVSSSSLSLKKEKSHKRKRLHIEEPVYVLPKTQWTPSGIFLEEDLESPRPLKNSTATQFLVASLKDEKKNKNFPSVVSSSSINSALNFKQNALFNNKVPRQEVRGMLYRKQRKLANKQF